MASVVFKQEALRSLETEAEKRLVAAGFQVEADIKKSFVAGTGRVYMKGKKRNIVHIASEAGQPPAVDTGRLRASISTNWSGSGMSVGKVDSKALPGDGINNPGNSKGFTVRVGTRAMYAPWLEFGTRRMAARPFMRPAFDRMKNKLAKFIAGSTK